MKGTSSKSTYGKDRGATERGLTPPSEILPKAGRSRAPERRQSRGAPRVVRGSRTPKATTPRCESPIYGDFRSVLLLLLLLEGCEGQVVGAALGGG